MRLGYNTNGFAFHRLDDAIDILAEIGYRSIALTLDYQHLDPFAADLDARLARVGDRLARQGMTCTIETGSRFLLDPRRKHQPTLIGAELAGRRQRIDFLGRAVRIAAELGAESVSLWSGTADDEANPDELMDRLCTGLVEVLEQADRHGVRLAMEPEPGMFIERMDQFERLIERINHERLGLTLDVGHLHCLDDGKLADHLARWQDRLFNVHFEDMRRGQHEHLFFGEGQMDFSKILSDLSASQYTGPIHVELSRHSANAVETARKAMRFLKEHGG